MSGSRRFVVVLAVLRWPVLLLLLTTSCASVSLKADRPEIEVQGYVLARAPSADADHFIGRRYEAGRGAAGDRPCTMGDTSEAVSQQRLSATLSRKQLMGLDLGVYELFGAAANLEIGTLDAIRVELTTTRRAQAEVDSKCKEPVIFDAIAGTLYVEYQFRQTVDVGAKVRALGVGEAGVKLKVDEERKLLSTTIGTDEFVAYQVHEPKDDRFKNILLVAAGIAIGVTGFATDIILARDGKDNILEWLPIGMYAAGGATAGYGVIRW